MKPLGIRFENFACFDECYLPLEPGVQILVGKNNSGKTALLRGLTALTALPIGDVRALPFNLGTYARRTADPSSFDFHVEFELEESDFALLGGALQQHPLAPNSKTRLFDFRFRLFADENQIGLVGALLRLDNEQFVVLDRQNQVAIQYQYNQIGQRIGTSQLAATSQRAMGRQIWPILAPSGIFAALAPLMHVRMIEAHRVVAPELNMQAVEQLTPNVQALTQFLDTLYGNNRRKFQHVESLVTRVFPEIEFINLEKRQNSVSLALTKRGSDASIPLTYWGTGVEQVLALATFVLTAPTGSLLLLDEPHSYLHPSAEREIITFLLEHPEHRYVISTHSATLVNSVSPDKVVALNSPRITHADYRRPPQIAELLHSMGYKNSDFLFSDRLIFVEGESDQEILPILLAKSGGLDQSDIAKTGFPKMDGEGRLRGTSQQTSLIYFEKFLTELGNSLLPRMYLFDGDCREDDRQVLRNTPALASNESARIGFLPRCEIENYLLVPGAIVQAIRSVADLGGIDISTATEDTVN